MRIQIVMSLVGRLLYIFGVFTLIPFIYSVVFETAYWSFLITTSLSLVLGTLLSYYGCESQSFSIRDGFLVYPLLGYSRLFWGLYLFWGVAY